MLEHLHQLAVHAYYAGELEAGRRACETLLAMQLTPEKERLVRRNRSWYTQTLDELVGCRFHRFDVEPAQEGWSTFNPTIISHDEGYLAIVRSSNYTIVDGRYVIPPADGETIRTVNMLVRLDESLAVQGEVAGMPDPLYPKSSYPVVGLEDCRLNSIDGEMRVSATVRNWAGRDGTCRIATATLLPHMASIIDAEMLDEPCPGRHEKNWMPIVGTDSWLYSCWEEGRTAFASRNGSAWKIDRRGESPAIARGWRGGSQVIDAGGGRWLCLVHEVADDEGRRIYEHRFVLFGDSCDIIGWSPAFAFREKRTIEFAAGLARRGDQLVATFGVRDAEAWIAEMSLAEVLAMIGGGNG
jgi:predicted GH43/DUF377 family glycosyl hydrolase